MSILHTINKSPYEKGSLISCVRFLAPNDALILIEDGVYAAVARGASAPTVRNALAKGRVFVLDADLTARGVPTTRLIDGVQVVDYEEFVGLCVEFDKVHSWL